MAPEAETATLHDERTLGYFDTENVVVDDYGPIIGAYGLSAYMIIARHAGRKDVSFPGYPLIARKMACSQAKAKQAVAVLVAVGLIRKAPRFNEHGGQKSNQYTLLNAKPLSTEDAQRLAATLKQQGGGTPRLPQGGGHVVDGGGIPRLPKEDSVKKTQKEGGAHAGFEKTERRTEAPTCSQAVLDAWRNVAVGEPTLAHARSLDRLAQTYGEDRVLQALDQFAAGSCQSPNALGATLKRWQKENSWGSPAPTYRKERAPSSPPAGPTAEQLAAPAVAAYVAQFGTTPTATQAEKMIAKVSDLAVWARALEYWALGTYNPANVGGLIERYDRLLAESPAKTTRPQPLSAAEIAARITTPPPVDDRPRTQPGLAAQLFAARQGAAQ